MRRRRNYGIPIYGLLVLGLLAPASLSPKRALEKLGKWTNQAVSAVGRTVLRSEEMNVAGLSGVEPDGATGGLSALALGVVGNAALVALLFRSVERLRRNHPLHEGNLLRETWVPWGSQEMLAQKWGWLRAAMSLNTDDVEAAAGLDAAMMVEFADLSMQVLSIIGLPLICILCPLHFFCGGSIDQDDPLSWIGMANVESGSWLCWVHSGIVWFVVIVVQHSLKRAQASFVGRRVQWLRRMPPPRCKTILVEHIPPEHCSDSGLIAYFNSVFGREVVETAHVTRNTRGLRWHLSMVRRAEEQLEEATEKFEETGERPRAFFPQSPCRPATADHIMLESPVSGEVCDVIEHWAQELQTERSALHDERWRLGLCGAGEPDFASGAYTTNGFVTFLQRRDAEIALRMQYRAHGLQFVVSPPPAPEDVRFEDLQKREMGFGDFLLGYSCILFLFWAFAPFIVAFSAVARLETLQTIMPSLHVVVILWPVTRAIWDGLASAFALGLFMSLLPNWLMFICEWLFVMKSGRQLQLQLQTWYFYFLVVFVLMVTAIGSSLFYTLSRLVEHPAKIFSLLANTLPYSTHFYLSYFPLQWSVYAMEATRYTVVVKYFALKALWGAERAKEACEPEDQANYGIGARSARMALLLVMALLFCSLSPLICVLGFICFFVCRVTYAYLLVYSETPKADTGGTFWCAQLNHVQQGLFIYVLLMTGVLLDKSDSLGPPLITFACGVALMKSYLHFRRRFQWHGLPFEDLSHEDEKVPQNLKSGITYRQSELQEVEGKEGQSAGHW
ncbi:CSC1-like protein ERD4 (Protein EARLY-RESPONSIVE TO DEHYDRATION STRESS 4) [Durusdinium trenchii]|uniref:CSC1-like protein ERD4 (Protein EARLY-RESPONSIVE TO DEHYDRATION STRESS 4) n=1 Tax=Durusdinium trenchii TaxID=1381693 RepID=A0ABP0PL86_9DINO